MAIEWLQFSAMRRARPSFAPALTECPIDTLGNVPVARIIRTIEAGDAIEIIAKAIWRDIDQVSWRVEVIAPGVSIHSLACRMGRPWRWLMRHLYCWFWSSS